MNKYYLLISFLLLINFILLIPGQASAEEYAIHLDTSEVPDPGAYEVLGDYGEIYIVDASEGFTTTLLGPFDSKVIASEVLNSVRREGYYAAFITKHRSASTRETDTKKKRYRDNSGLEVSNTEKVISKLD